MSARVNALRTILLGLWLGLAAMAAPDKGGTGASAISLPSGPGSIEGLGDSFEPQLNTGTMGYGVGLMLPPGRAGLQPTIHIGYEGGSGNGLLGLGWTFGFGSIRRQTDKGLPVYNESDTFVMGAEELVPLSNPEQDWRLKNEGGFQRFRRIPGGNGWEVTDPTGTKHFYGRFHGEGGRWSVVSNPSLNQGTDFDQTYLWSLDATVDLHGNRVEYEYTPGDGILYPSRITWSHWPDSKQSGSTNYHEVLFLYESRPDVFEDYRPSFATRTELRLHRIEVASFYEGVRHLVRSYEFEYDYRPEDLITPPDDSLDTGVSLLKRVIQYGSLGNTNDFLPPLLLQYSPLQLGDSRLETLDTPPELNLAEVNGKVQLVDIDGDGLPDLFQTTELDQRFQLNQGVVARNGLAPQLTWGSTQIQPAATAMQLSNPESALMDFNNDGLVDYVQLEDNLLGGRDLITFKNASSLDRWDVIPPGFKVDAEYSYDLPAGLSLTNAATRQADINFDKLTDFVTTIPGFIGQFQCVYRDLDGRWQTTYTDYPSDLPGAFTFAWHGEGGQPSAFLVDMNGDRMPDLVLVEQDGLSLRIRYWPGLGLGIWGAAHEMGVTAPDVFTMETGDLRDVFIQDLTGDGLADLLMVDGSSEASRIVLRVNLAGAGWSTPTERVNLPRYRPRDAGIPTTLRFADVNGSGTTDLIWVNPGLNPGWQWLELLPNGRPNLLRRTDNSLGKIMEVTYTTTTEDLIRAREKGYPWQTKTPFPLPVIRRLRVTASQDLDGTPDAGLPFSTDQYITEYQYRDPYYDPIERQFRGFAFAQSISWGDDVLLDTNMVSLVRAPGWDQGRTPTGQVPSPTQVTRLRYITGAPDGVDNDEYPSGYGGTRYVDEVTPNGGREEEPLKGKQLWMEVVDGWVMHDPQGAGDFDRGCWLTQNSTNAVERAQMTPDAYTYSRLRQDWLVRRLYRSDLPQPFNAQLNGDTVDYTDVPLLPPGTFSAATPSVTVLPQSGRTVSWPVLTQVEEETIEANGLLQDALGHPARTPIVTRKAYAYDDYGNTIREEEYGIISTNRGNYHDKRFEHFTYAMGGMALQNWTLRLLAESLVTDDKGVFVNRSRSYYDGEPYVGLPLGEVGARALMHRTERFVNGDIAVPALEAISDQPGDPRLPVGKSVIESRGSFDTSGNQVSWLDPLAVLPSLATGHARSVVFDPVFNSLAVEEHDIVGNGDQDLVQTAEYDYGFSKLIRNVDANGQVGTYHYDQFARITSVVTPGDSEDLPTLVYEYLEADPVRGRVYRYDLTGHLAITAEDRPVSRIVTRQREQSGQTNAYVNLKYVDGSGRSLVLACEGDVPGHWVVLEATGYGRRGTPDTTWQPFDINYGSSDADIPPFNVLWTSAGRPPLSDTDGRAVVPIRAIHDPLGRPIVQFQPPEDYLQLAQPPKEIRTFHLPHETWTLDENDNDPLSPHAMTPNVTISDGLGRIVEHQEHPRVDDAGLPTSTPQTWSTTYHFDLNEHLTSVTDSQGNTTWFRYDGLGRLIYLNDPDRGAVWKTYDDASNEIEGKDAKGQVTRLTHDGLNRVLTEDYVDDGSKEFSYGRTPDVRFHYDSPAGSMDMGDGTTAAATFTKGRVSWVEDTSGEAHYSYDARGREAWSLRRLPDWTPSPAGDIKADAPLVSFRMAYSYDAANRLTRRVFPDNDEYTYEYSSRNLQSGLRGTFGPIITDIRHHPSGRPVSMTFGNGVTTRFTYDPRHRTSAMETDGVASGTPGVLLSYTYAHDGSSMITAVQDKRPASTRPEGDPLRNSQAFTYDDLYRITSVKYNHSLPGGTGNGGEIDYRYDRIGNMLEQSSNLAHTNRGVSLTQLGQLSYGGVAGTAGRTGRTTAAPGPHALTHVTSGDRSLTYDADGNVRNLDGADCVWDFKNRLVALDDAAVRSDYRYDYRDQRKLRQVTWKNGGPGATNRNFTVLYPFPDYEIREGDQPVKYAMLNSVRVCRLTGSFSATARVQRIRLQPGWNLVSLEVASTNVVAQLAPHTGGVPVFRYDPASRGYIKINAGELVAAGTVLWINSSERTVASISGSLTAPGPKTLPGGGQFLAGDGLTARALADLPAGVMVWQFDAGQGVWVAPQALPNVGQAARPPPFLGTGEVVFLDLEVSLTLAAPDPAAAVLYYHPDFVGSVAMMTDGLGRRVQETAYYPFGAKRTEERSLPGTEPYGFSGRELDEESGFVYMCARFQLPGLARFLSVDPKLALDPGARTGNPQSLNFYAYALNNPIGFSDPTGCEPQGADALMSSPDDHQSHQPPPDNAPAEEVPTVQALPSAGTLRFNLRPGVSVEIYVKGEAKLTTGVYVGDARYISGAYEVSSEFDTLGNAQFCQRVGAVGAKLRINYTAYKACTGGGPPKKYDVMVQNKPDFNKREGTHQTPGRDDWKETIKDSKNKDNPNKSDRRLMVQGKWSESAAGRLEGYVKVGGRVLSEYELDTPAARLVGTADGTLSAFASKKGSVVSAGADYVGQIEGGIYLKIPPQLKGLVQIPIIANGNVNIQVRVSVDLAVLAKEHSSLSGIAKL